MSLSRLTSPRSTSMTDSREEKQNAFLKKYFVAKPNAERSIKALLAASYNQDARGLLQRAHFCLHSKFGFEHDRKLRAKILVDLLMSAECSLKSLIFGLSKNYEPPEKLYKKSKQKWGHDLGKLLIHARNRAKNKLKFPSDKKLPTFADASKMNVFIRYSVETYFLIMERSLRDQPYVDPLIKKTTSETWMWQFMDDVNKILRLSSEAHNKFCSRHMNSRTKGYNKRLKAFFTNISPSTP